MIHLAQACRFAGFLATLASLGLSHAATLTVTSAADSGIGSLREAIGTANASSGGDPVSIVFSIPGAGTHTIRPESPLPTIQHAAVIDATTQPGYGGKPLIELDGSLAGSGAWGFEIRAGPCAVRGFAINRFSGGGILLAGGDDVVQANFIGTDLSGTEALPNGTGIFVYIAPRDLIGGSTPETRNVISGNLGAGVTLGGYTNRARVLGNFIGTDVTGTSALGNETGVNMSACEDEVGGTAPGSGNLISGNRNYGILAGGARSLIRGNWIGIDQSGKSAIGGASGPQTGMGVFIWGSGEDTQIGGTSPGAGNVIAGYQHGIDIRGKGTVIEGNYIGVDPSGSVGLPNYRGIALGDLATGNRIGGTVPGAGNLISANLGEAILLEHATVHGNQVLGNRIGVDSTGVAPLGNQRGVIIGDDSHDNTIGGIDAGAGNTIANSKSQGIVIGNNAATQNRIRGNAIYGNGSVDQALGIDLGWNGVSTNDLEDADLGPNQLQNFPELKTASTTLTNITITGGLFSMPNHDFELDFFAAEACHPSGYGEARQYLGSQTITTDAAGQVEFSVSVAAMVPVGWIVTATATDAAGNSSEFSRCVPVTAAWPALVSAETRGNLNGLTVEFSLPPEGTSVLNPTNFAITGGVIVTGVTRITSYKVRLETSTIVEGQTYTLTVSNVRSADGSVIPPGSTIDFLQTQGVIKRKVFDGISGSWVSDLTNNARFPSNPNTVGYLTSLEGPMNTGDNYGQQVQGFLTAPASGDYVFYICSDNQSVLYLSPDQNPLHKQLIATDPQSNPPRAWIGNWNTRLQIPADFVSGSFFIEAEDFDFAGGQHKASADSMPYLGGAYSGLSAIAEIDYHDPGANENAGYRSADQGVAIRSNSDLNRGSFSATANYQVGWNEAGDWFNYTRSFSTPGQDYYVLARLASGGANMHAELDVITVGAGTTNQTVVKAGEFIEVATGSWDQFTFVPLRDGSSNLAIVHLEGETTLRFTVLPGGLDFDYLALRPVSSGPPDLSQLRPKNISAPIHLEAGRKYYLEALQKESSGDDNLAVAWLKPGDPTMTNGAPPIPGRYLSTLDALVPVVISTQPTNQTVKEGESVTFSAAITGTPTYDFQWFRNGQMILGATASTYTMAPVEAADDGASFHVLTGNGISSVRSDNAVLRVLADRTAPTVVSVRASSSFNQVVILFSEPINAQDATNISHFEFSGGLLVTRAFLAGDGRTVTLFTSEQLPGTLYSLTVTGVHDLARTPNMIAAGNATSFNSFVVTRGFLRREMWLGIPGTSLPEMTNLTRFPDAPDTVNYVTSAEIPPRMFHNYGVRLVGYVLPPATGDYVFYISSYNEGALFLSRDEYRGGLQLIASEPAGNPSRQWADAPNQVSRGSPACNVSIPIRLESGRRYYFEALMKAGEGAECLGITWRKPGDLTPENASEPIPGSCLAAPAESSGANIAIIADPTDVTVPDHQRATFKVKAAASTDERFFQWQRNGLDIPGANSRSYTTPPVSSPDDGSRFRCITSIPGASIASVEAVLTVVPDSQPPRLVSAEGNIGLNQVTLAFSEPVDPADVGDSSHFILNGGVSVLASRPDAEGTRIILSTTPQTEGAEYTVTVTGVHDQSASSNAIVAGSQINFFAWENEEFVGPFASWADAKRDFGAIGDGVADDTDALQRALDVLGNPTQPLDPVIAGRPYVLWLPAGTYRITRGLVFRYRTAVSMFGEDPATTIIKWDGGSDGVMLHCNGLAYSAIGRITFDGSATALVAIDHKWDGSNQPSSTTGSEYSDLVIRNVQFGMRAGVNYNDAEVAVVRCHFLDCSQSGISMESGMAVDWWVRDSKFDRCRRGINNNAGACNVYGSVFKNSIETDIWVCQANFVSFRNNTSIGSKTFLVAIPSGTSDQIIVQGNTIIDPQDRLVINNLDRVWSLMLLDNIIRSRPEFLTGPVVACGDNLVSVGNTFTVSSPLRSDGRIQSIGDRVADRTSLVLADPALPGPLPRRERNVVEIPVGSSATAIQSAIDSLAPQMGHRPVLHLPTAIYRIDRTLMIPSGSDLQLVGDGLRASTTLQWSGVGRGPIMSLGGPTKATLRNLTIAGSPQVIGLVVQNCDQPLARVYMDQIISSWCRKNVVVDRLDDTEVSLLGSAHAMSAEASFQIIGGPKREHGQLANGRVAMFGGSSSANELSYDVSKGGRFVGQDLWHEGPQPRFIRLVDLGSFTLQGAKVQRYSGSSLPAVEVASFRGDVALITTFFDQSGVTVTADSTNSRVLVLGAGVTPGDNLFTNHSSEAEFALLHGLRWWWDAGASSFVTLSQPGQGYCDPSFLADLLEPARSEHLRPLCPLPASSTDARFSRVLVWQCDVGIMLTRSNSPPAFVDFAPNRTIDEGSTLVFTNTAIDPDGISNLLTYALAAGAPQGMTIDMSTGVIRWTPSEAQGPRDYPITVIVTDGGLPPRSDSRTCLVTVNEINSAPALPVQTNVTVTELATLVVTNTATDSDIPSNPLTYQLLNPPTGATIDPQGIITWTPTHSQAPSTNLLGTLVTDNAVPPLSSSNYFTVYVKALRPIQIAASVTPNGDMLLTMDGDAGFTYSLLVSTNLTDWVQEQVFPNIATTPFVYTNRNAGMFSARFYRVRREL